jgi:hypothetical protein
MNEGLAGGALLVILGVFVMARTVIHDDAGDNLVDRLLAVAGGGGGSSTTTQLGPLPVPKAGHRVGPIYNPGTIKDLSLKAPTSVPNALDDLQTIGKGILKGIAPVFP